MKSSTAEGPVSRFELLEHTGDLGLEIWSETPEGIFEAAARGLFSILSDLDSIHAEIQRRIELQGSSMADLLVDWLRELNFLSITEDLLFCRFEIELDGSSLKALISGEPISPDKHRIHREVKAVTYHDLVFEKSKTGWYARVIFDL